MSTYPYEEFLRQVDARSWSKCDTLSGELCTSVNVMSDSNTAVLIFECHTTNKPHVRTVILDRPDPDTKWHVRSENMVNLPVALPTPAEHVCTTSNTPETVESVTPSITLTGRQVDRLRHLCRKSIDALGAAEINKANDDVVAAVMYMIGLQS